MVKFMLSFDRGKIIAIMKKKSDKSYMKPIRAVKTKNRDAPDLIVDNMNGLIDDEDILMVGRAKHLSVQEKKIIAMALEADDNSRLNPRLKDAYNILVELSHDKLKTEIDMTDNDDIYFQPPFGHNGIYDRHIFIVGNSGAGKSYFTRQMIEDEPLNRPIILFSKVVDDKTFDGMVISEEEYADAVLAETPAEKKKLLKGKRTLHLTVDSEEDLLRIPNKGDLIEMFDELGLNNNNGLVIIFDDVNTYENPIISEFIQGYMSDALETSRHDNISVVATSHQLKAGNATKTNRNEMEYLTLFPSENYQLSSNFLKEAINIPKRMRDVLMNRSCESKYMSVKLSNPMALICEKGISLI